MTTLKKGVIHLLKPFTICSAGDLLTPEQAKLLKLFQRPLAQFQIKVKAQWNKKSEQVRVFDVHNDDDADQANEEEEQQQQAEDNDDEEMIDQDNDENEHFHFFFVICYFERIYIQIFC